MSEEKEKQKETTAEVVIEEEEEETEEDVRIENIQKIEELVKELDKVKQNGGPDIRICPKCFSLRIKEIDIIGKMGIFNSYPTCVCQDCGWRSNKWLYLDRVMSTEERNAFFKDVIAKEKDKEEKLIQ